MTLQNYCFINKNGKNRYFIIYQHNPLILNDLRNICF